MGGMGKTTLARAIFNKIRSGFEGAVFLDKVTEESQKFGLSHLRQTLLSGILDDPHASLESTFTKNRLSNKKILLVFDDVTDWEDIEKLIGDLKCFGPKSRIILTARDKQVLKNCEVEHDNIYEIKGLHHNDAFKLFSRHAFKLDHPIASYEMLSKNVVVFDKGVPLALKVLGGLLFGKTNVEWESALADLEKNPEPKINNVLKLSYDRLNNQEKDIFIDSACFFKGAERDFLIKILDVNEFTLANLIDKSLITIDYNRIRMHDLLQNMGRTIVEQESKYPGGRSRLWHHDDILHVLRTNTGTQAIEGIHLDMSKIGVINLNRNAFSKMCMLRYFDFYWPGICQQRTCVVSHDCLFPVCDRRSSSFFFLSPKRYKGWVHAPEGLEFASSELRFFRWVGYPLESLPSNFDSRNLIALLMPYSNIKQLSEGPQYSETLTHINLMYCKHLIRISDLSLTPNLESLILEGCTNLIEVPSTIQSLDKLVTLNLNGCTSLRSLPTGISTKFLSLIGCSNLDMAPEITSKMEKLYLDGTAIKELSVIKLPSRLKILSLRNCSRLESLSNAICELKSLKDLHMTGCPKLDRMPHDFGNLEALESLYVDHTAIRRVPSSICRSKRPVGLASPTSLGLISLSRLNLSCCQITELPDNLGQLSSLEYLHLSRNYFACIPPSVEKLSKLSELHVRYCEKLQFLPKVSSMVPCVVDATGCTSLEKTDCLKFRFEPGEDRWKFFLDLLDCYKLDQNQVAKDYVEYLSKYYQKITDRYVTLLPGSEIPDCFDIRNMDESSLTIKPPSELCAGHYRLYFAVCGVVGLQGRNHQEWGKSYFSFYQKINCTDKYGNQEGRETHLYEFFMTKRVEGQGDHVFMTKDYVDSGVINFTWELFCEGCGESIEVKKIGLKFIGAEPIEVEDEKGEEGPQPKGLKLN